MPTPQKKQKIDKLVEKLNKAEAVYLTQYQGLTHQELEILRKKIKGENADYTIVKNTLFKIALSQSQIKNFPFNLAGPTAILLAYKDPVKPLQKFSSGLKNRVKAAFAFGEFLTGEKLDRLVEIDPPEILRAKLVSQLAFPLYKSAYSLNWNLQRLAAAINKVKTKKSEMGSDK